MDLDWEKIFYALVPALAGAGAGAYAAQWIAARNKRIDERLKEVRAASAATTIAYGIADHFIGMKEQLVKPTVDAFIVEREKFERADAAPKPLGVSVIEFKVPLDTFRFNWSPSEELQNVVFEDLSAPVRPMMLVPILTRSIAMLDKLADDRNTMMKDFNAIQKAGKPIDPYAYYGVPYPTGGADQRYMHSLQHIADYTDDVIHFSRTIGDDLREFTLALRQTLPLSMQPLAPRVVTISFQSKAHLLPSPEKYKSYEHLQQPIRVLGLDGWNAAFEALALSQYRGRSEHWLYRLR